LRKCLGERSVSRSDVQNAHSRSQSDPPSYYPGVEKSLTNRRVEGQRQPGQEPRRDDSIEKSNDHLDDEDDHERANGQATNRPCRQAHGPSTTVGQEPQTRRCQRPTLTESGELPTILTMRTILSTNKSPMVERRKFPRSRPIHAYDWTARRLPSAGYHR